MPRFLNKNHLPLAVQQQRDAFNSMLLVVPHHLEQVSGYPHLGKPPSTAYKRPWLRAQEFNNSLDLTDSALPWEEWLGGCTEIEPFYSEIGEISRSGDSEIIPSSNPDSWSSVEKEQADLTTQTWDLELFEKEDLNDEYSEDSCLEDVMSTTQLHDHMTGLPSVEVLMKHLKPQVILDPFLDSNGQKLVEKKFFRKERQFIDPENSEDSCFHNEPKSDKEQFHKDPSILCTQELMEEELSFSPSVNHGCKTPNPDQIVPGACEIRDILPMEEEILSLEPQDIKATGLKIFCEENKTEEIELSPFANNTVSENQDFLLCKQADLSTTSAFLETPEVLTMDYGGPYVKSPWKELSPYEIALDQPDYILSEEEVKRLTQFLWNKEKYFNDILTMRLQEPDININFWVTITSKYAQDVLKLKPDVCAGTLELDLDWDPVQKYVTDYMECEAKDRVFGFDREMDVMVLSDESYISEKFPFEEVTHSY